MRAGRLFLLLLVAAGPLTAQTVIKPAPPLDSARAAVRDALVQLSDSLGTIDAAAARLQRDYEQASGASLLYRARMMREACSRSAGIVPSTRERVVATKVSEPQRAHHQTNLLSALDQLKADLGRCESEFSKMSQAGQSETVRGYGNDRAVRVQGALRRYEHTLHEFYGVMGIRVVPAGAQARPASG
jgi:hypothetical protein